MQASVKELSSSKDTDVCCFSPAYEIRLLVLKGNWMGLSRLDCEANIGCYPFHFHSLQWCRPCCLPVPGTHWVQKSPVTIKAWAVVGICCCFLACWLAGDLLLWWVLHLVTCRPSYAVDTHVFSLHYINYSISPGRSGWGSPRSYPPQHGCHLISFFFVLFHLVRNAWMRWSHPQRCPAAIHCSYSGRDGIKSEHRWQTNSSLAITFLSLWSEGWICIALLAMKS